MMTYSFIYMIVTKNQSEINKFRLQYLKYKHFKSMNLKTIFQINECII